MTRPSFSPEVGDVVSLEIERLGGLGDGVGCLMEKPVFVPLTAPGDTVRARLTSVGAKLLRAELKEVLAAGRDRAPAPCRHFGECGGCRLQHLAEEVYFNFKEGMLRQALQRAGFDSDTVTRVVGIGAGNRRRAEFQVIADHERARVGFFARRSHRLIDLANCPVLATELERLIPHLRILMPKLTNPPGLSRVRSALTETGIDATFVSRDAYKNEDFSVLLTFSEENDIARISWSSEEETLTVISRRSPQIRAGEVRIDLPQGAFIQATEKGQRVITDEVLEALEGCATIADLYAGCGTLTFAIAPAVSRVEAFDGNAAMVGVLKSTAKNHGLASRVGAEVRDLFRFPLSAQALNRFDAVIINPPRNGAGPQVKSIAESEIPTVVMVSCYPRSLERDAGLLRSGGYLLARAVPLDQFYWSTHLESVLVFRRNP